MKQCYTEGAEISDAMLGVLATLEGDDWGARDKLISEFI